MKQWRLIPNLKTNGRMQMAIDRWLWEQHRQGRQPPTLRFYHWSPPAISLGCHQKRFPQTWTNLTWQGEKIELVYRPTGGKAVLHQGDLTYMVVTSALSGNPRQDYRHICQFLIEGWRSLGIELSYGRAGRGYIHNPNCFAIATGADLVDSRGNKFIGSAQLRGNGILLQHGSMSLYPNPKLYEQVFGTTLKISQDQIPAIDEITGKLREAAESCFACQLNEQPLSPQEWQAINSSQQPEKED